MKYHPGGRAIDRTDIFGCPLMYRVSQLCHAGWLMKKRLFPGDKPRGYSVTLQTLLETQLLWESQGIDEQLREEREKRSLIW